MKYTNHHNLPDAFVNFAERDTYSKGEADISVTSLIDSPRVRLMREHYKDQMSSDVVDLIWPLFGTAVHHILEQDDGKDVIREERLFYTDGEWVLSGAIDHQKTDGRTIEITDYKVTSVWSVIHGKPEWENQLNTYAFLVQKAKGVKVTKLQICAILRDWNRRDAENKADYPDAPVVVVDIPLWTDQARIRYVHERLALHKGAQITYDLEEVLEDKFISCTREDRWSKPDTWAVKKRGNKRAMRVFDNINDANDYSAAQSVPTEIEYRAGEHTRCKGNYCGVADFCSQYKGD